MTDTEPSATTEDDPPQTPAGLADERFAVNVREQRERKGMSQADIAETMRERGWSWHPQTVQRIESGHRKVSVGEAEALAGILHTTMDRLTWPGQEASIAALLDMTIAKAFQAWDDIAHGTSVLLSAQRQLETTTGEAERAGYLGSAKVRDQVREARDVLLMTPERAVEEGRAGDEKALADVAAEAAGDDGRQAG